MKHQNLKKKMYFNICNEFIYWDILMRITSFKNLRTSICTYFHLKNICTKYDKCSCFNYCIWQLRAKLRTGSAIFIDIKQVLSEIQNRCSELKTKINGTTYILVPQPSPAMNIFWNKQSFNTKYRKTFWMKMYI